MADNERGRRSAATKLARDPNYFKRIGAAGGRASDRTGTKHYTRTAFLQKLKAGQSEYFDEPYSTIRYRYYNAAKRLGIEIAIRTEGTGCRLTRTT